MLAAFCISVLFSFFCFFSFSGFFLFIASCFIIIHVHIACDIKSTSCANISHSPNSLSKPVSGLFPNISIEDSSVVCKCVSWQKKLCIYVLVKVFYVWEFDVLSVQTRPESTEYFLAGDTQVEDMTYWGLGGCEGLTGQIREALPYQNVCFLPRLLGMLDLQEVDDSFIWSNMKWNPQSALLLSWGDDILGLSWQEGLQGKLITPGCYMFDLQEMIFSADCCDKCWQLWHLLTILSIFDYVTF